MMTATGKLQALEISRNGVPVAVLNQSKGTFTLDGQTYTVRRIGIHRSYELRRDGDMVAFAKGVPFVNRSHVTLGDKSLLLKAENFRATRFGLYDGETRIGGVTPAGWFRPWNGATIDMPDTLPLEAQLFVTAMVVDTWGEGSST
jgi:hypothetical protein